MTGWTVLNNKDDDDGQASRVSEKDLFLTRIAAC